MRIIVLFDLPTLTSDDRKNYRKFMKILNKNGFIMNQESFYSKIVLNNNSAESIKNILSKNCPPEGLVEILVITEKQYNSIIYITGKKKDGVIDSDERVVRI
jgi:CRISPR-associated protein Cas2